MSGEPKSILLKKARIVDPGNNVEGDGHIIINDGTIEDIIWGANAPPKRTFDRVVDCSGLLLFPLILDARVFGGEPGSEHLETFANLTLAADHGGVGGVVYMPNTHPLVDNVTVVNHILRVSQGASSLRVYPTAMLTAKGEGRELTEFGLLLDSGVVGFTDGLTSVMDTHLMRCALKHAKDYDALLMPFIQDLSLSRQGVMHEGVTALRLGLSGIPSMAETIMLERDLTLLRDTPTRYHAVMVSCAESVELVRRAKQEHLPVTCSVSINHLLFTESDVGQYRTFFKFSPPLRTKADQQALLNGVKDGTIDAIVSDHRAQGSDMKRRPFDDSGYGAIGVEFLLPACLSLEETAGINMMQLLKCLTVHPSRIIRADFGSLANGSAANLCGFARNGTTTIEKRSIHSLCHNTPLLGMSFKGSVRFTVRDGQIVYDSHKDIPCV